MTPRRSSDSPSATRSTCSTAKGWLRDVLAESAGKPGPSAPALPPGRTATGASSAGLGASVARAHQMDTHREATSKAPRARARVNRYYSRIGLGLGVCPRTVTVPSVPPDSSSPATTRRFGGGIVPGVSPPLPGEAPGGGGGTATASAANAITRHARIGRTFTFMTTPMRRPIV